MNKEITIDTKYDIGNYIINENKKDGEQIAEITDVKWSEETTVHYQLNYINCDNWNVEKSDMVDINFDEVVKPFCPACDKRIVSEFESYESVYSWKCRNDECDVDIYNRKYLTGEGDHDG